VPFTILFCTKYFVFVFCNAFCFAYFFPLQVDNVIITLFCCVVFMYCVGVTFLHHSNVCAIASIFKLNYIGVKGWLDGSKLIFESS
jgi:hypothetical protein